MIEYGAVAWILLEIGENGDFGIHGIPLEVGAYLGY
jgi:hypothetical protein